MTTIHKAAREALETLRLARDRIVDEGGSGWKALVTRCNRDYMALRAALDEAPGEEQFASVARRMYAAHDAYGAGFYGETDWREAYAELRAMLADRPDAPTVALTEECKRNALAQKVLDRLVLCYLTRPADVADACDESIDRSGNLLGWIRDAARKGKEGGA